MKILEYIQSESDRQSATLDETINMVEVWKYTKNFTKFPNLATIKYMAYILNGSQGYRIVPAVFNQGSPAINADLIPNAMEKWHDWAYRDGKSPEFTEVVIKEFLEIHPFEDGNGRIASLLYNYLKGTLDDPIPLPYYFEQN